MLGFCLRQEVDSPAHLRNRCTMLDHLEGDPPTSFFSVLNCEDLPG